MKFVKGEKNEVHGRGKCHGGSTLSGWIPATDLPCHKAQGACLELWVSGLYAHGYRGKCRVILLLLHPNQAELSPAGLASAPDKKHRDLKPSVPVPAIPHSAMTQRKTCWPRHRKNGPSCKRRAWDPQKQRTAFSSHTHSSTEGQETPKSVDSRDTSPHPHLCPVEREPQEVQGRMGNLLLLPDQSNGPQTHKLWTTVMKPEAEALSEEVRGTGCGVLETALRKIPRVDSPQSGGTDWEYTSCSLLSIPIPFYWLSVLIYLKL